MTTKKILTRSLISAGILILLFFVCSKSTKFYTENRAKHEAEKIQWMKLAIQIDTTNHYSYHPMQNGSEGKVVMSILKVGDISLDEYEEFKTKELRKKFSDTTTKVSK